MMHRARSHPLGLRMQPLAACLAAIWAASLSAPAFSNVDPTPRAPASIVVTNCDDSGPGSLRDSVEAAASGDTIDMTQLTCSRISTTTGAIIVTQDQLALIGPGSNALTIDGIDNGGYAVLFHVGDSSLSVQDLTIANGNKYRSTAAALGGCIYSTGNVIVEYANIQGCTTRSTGVDPSLGGAIFSYGQTYLKHARISGNTTFATGGYSEGAGVYSKGGFIAKYSTVENNASFTQVPPSFGGGVLARGTVIVSESTISGNSAPNMGGMAIIDNNHYPAMITQSTISGNTADYIAGIYSRVPLKIYNSTIAFNNATHSTDPLGTVIAGGLQINDATTLYSTIISNNEVGAGLNDLGGTATATVGGSNNLMMFTTIAAPSDTITADPLLGPLQDNGGNSKTHRPANNSFAIDAGNNVLALSVDQRGPGFVRTAGFATDIGAFETNSDEIFANGFN